jgi:Protein of unknown function (DUF1549)/Protein of unknown function (DUF1553)/Planctomycete cytochrome C/EF-hand domain pair
MVKYLKMTNRCLDPDRNAVMKRVTSRLILGACLLAGGFAFGQEPAQPKFDPVAAFRRGDVNRDGKLSKEEFLKLTANNPLLKDRPDLALQLFQRLDADGDGFLTLEEFKKIADFRQKAPPKEDDKPAKPPNPDPKSIDAPTADQLAFFEKKIRPVLVAHCNKCHSAEAEKIKGGLALDTRDGVRKGGETGPAVVPGDLKRSLLIKAIRYQDENLHMPPKQKLSDEVIADLEHWVRTGAADPREGAVKVARPELDPVKGRQFWAFQPPKKALPPSVKDGAWPRSDVDRFLLAALEGHGLKPVADADARSLVRRVYFDLIGLPPTPEEVESFVKDTSPAAFEKLVDQLLASPHFGERWGRHWLDVARFGESSGKQVNLLYPNAWRYRDFVIGAFNADKPYDRFLKEQIAGDLMPARDAKQRAEQQVATGFLAIGPKDHNERNPLQFQMDVVDEQIDVMSQAMLGLTVACARCHDHKFDPIPQHDYYALAGIFRSTETCYGTLRLPQNSHPSALIKLPAESGLPSAVEKLTPTVRAQILRQIEEYRKTREQLAKVGKLMGTREGVAATVRLAILEAQFSHYEDDGTPKLLAMGVRDGSRAANSPLYVRGEVDKPGDAVPRGVVQVISRKAVTIPAGSGRLELADWLASPDNPLPARVMANRVWLHLFGRGLVPTPDNFGNSGHAPAHPELLDYLAVSFIENGWSVKKLIRFLVLSRAYQLSSRYDPHNDEIDPDNTYVWRHMKRRLDAESLRDSLLAISGQLERTPPIGSAVAKSGEGPIQVLLQRQAGEIRAENRLPHRTVYLAVVRNSLPDSLALFDFAEPSLVIGERSTTTVPAQGLFLLNNPVVIHLAEVVADRILTRDIREAERIDLAYRTVYGRPPTETELRTVEKFLSTYPQTEATPKSKRATWTALIQALFASADFLYVQ